MCHPGVYTIRHSMKTLSLLLSFFFFGIALSGCQNKSVISWPTLDGDAESICDSLEVLYQNDRAGNGKHLAEELDYLTKGENDPNKKARVLYWKYVTASPSSDSAKLWITRARELTDSAKYPYQYARIILMDDHFDRTSYLRRHTELRHAISLFGECGDSMMELFGYRTLSSFFLHIGDYDSFRQCAEAEEYLCREMGKDSLAAKNKINFVLSYTHSGDTVKAKKILDELLSNQYILSDSNFMGRIYVNLGNITADPDYYQKAIDISPVFRNTPELRQTLEFAKMKTYEAAGNYRRADSLLEILGPIVVTEGDYEAKGIMHAMLSRQAKQMGDYKRALEENAESRKFFDSTFNSDDRLKVSLITFKEEIERQEAQHKHEQQLSKTRLGAAIAILILCCLMLWIYYKGRQNKLLMRQYASEAQVAKLNLDLEKEKRNIAAMGLAMTERNNLIKDVMKIADQMHTDGAISSEAKQTIGQMVKISQASQDEWDNFQIAYTRVHPHFINRLKEKYPYISEGDTRLALYICAGLTTKQIAHAMHLQPDSVKKNRQRLRQRMQISSEISLEEELRQFL